MKDKKERDLIDELKVLIRVLVFLSLVFGFVMGLLIAELL